MSRNPELHKEHRKRTLDSYLTQESENIPDHILLEMLLYFSIPRRDTNELAHDLIVHCGSFNNVLDASEEDLKAVNGIGDHSADLIKLFGLVKRKYDINAAMPAKKQFGAISEIGEYMVALLKNRKEEALYMMMLDNKNKLILTRKMSEGSTDSVEITAKKIIEAALAGKCAKIVLAHNHPAGDCQPSDSDISSTLEVKRACDAVGITIVEHFIVAGADYIPIFAYIADLRTAQIKKLLK